MIQFDIRFLLIMLVAFAGLGYLGTSGAQAQTVFCPGTVASGGQVIGGITLTNGACTNPANFAGKVDAGAFSGAALAGQAIGNLAQSMSVVETATATRQISERRAVEERICPPGQTLTDGICRAVQVVAPPPAPAAAVPATPVRRLAQKRPPERVAPATPVRRVARRAPPPPVVVTVAPPPSYIIPSHWGAWAQGFGDYEERSGRGTSQIQCCAGVNPITLGLTANSSTTTAGFVGGIDYTSRNLRDAGDGLILGLMTGYLDSTVQVNTSVLSSQLPVGSTGVGNGFGSLRAHLTGPSIGFYATYFDGPWSNDFLVKNDFLDLNESFSDLQAFQTCLCVPGVFVPFTTTNAGTASTSLDEFTVSDNVHYRFPLMAGSWVEPTVGIQYTRSSYSGNAAAYGLRDGDLVRLQGGARVGEDTLVGAVPVTLAVTGLIYDDVLVSGDFVQGGVFGTSGNILNDEGKVRGEGILDVKFDLGSGRSVFVQGDVRGGDQLFGGGGKGGFRVEW